MKNNVVLSDIYPGDDNYAAKNVLLTQRTGIRYVVGGRWKRTFDLAVASCASVLALPLFACVAAVLKLTDPGPLLYKHIRVGLSGSRFSCLKFRTMIVDAECALHALLDEDPLARAEWHQYQKLADDPRVTAVGRVLRRTSLDELPQLINVIRGEMSLVGPRPVTQSELSRYGDRLGFYLSARPGLTGVWQISGRSDCDFDSRVKLDANYVADWCFSKDLLILLRTIGAVFNRKGSY